MNEYAKKRLLVLGGVLVLAVCLALIIVGQRSVGWGRLGLMVLGLCGMIALLYLYNRSVERPKPVNPPGKGDMPAKK